VGIALQRTSSDMKIRDRLRQRELCCHSLKYGHQKLKNLAGNDWHYTVFPFQKSLNNHLLKSVKKNATLVPARSHGRGSGLFAAGPQAEPREAEGPRRLGGKQRGAVMLRSFSCGRRIGALDERLKRGPARIGGHRLALNRGCRPQAGSRVDRIGLDRLTLWILHAHVRLARRHRRTGRGSVGLVRRSDQGGQPEVGPVLPSSIAAGPREHGRMKLSLRGPRGEVGST